MPGLYTFTGDPDEVWQNWVVRLEDGGPVVGYVQATRHLSAGSAELAWVVGAPPAPPEPSAAGRAAYCALGSAERRPLDIRLPLRRARR